MIHFLFLVIGLFFPVGPPTWQSEQETFLTAISWKEAKFQEDAVGDNGKAIGPFQIWECYWKDAVEFDKNIGGSYSDCKRSDYSRKVVSAYMNRYAKKAYESGDWKTCARIHNGGPSGAKKKATLSYGEDIEKIIREKPWLKVTETSTSP